MPNFMKICQVGSELFHADRRTDMTKLIVAIRNFANAPKIPSSALETARGLVWLSAAMLQHTALQVSRSLL